MADIIDLSKFDQKRLSKVLPSILDEEGKIVPEAQDIAAVESEHPDRSPAEKWQLAQAARLLRAYGRKGE
jgi:hypothetical protein